MIQIAGRPYDAAALMASYPENSVPALVLQQMQDSTETYRFSSEEELKFSLSLREETVNAARALNRSGMRFANFYDSTCNEAYWDRTNNGGFQLKRGAAPDQAILDIFKNGRLYATECATAMVIVIYRALLAVYGADLFNKTFPSIYLMGWTLRQPLLQEIGTPRPVADILLGDRVYFMNPQVSAETPWWRGENAIVLPDGLYYGHGVGIRTADEIINSLNRNRQPGATQSAYLMDAAARPNDQKLFAVMQRQERAQPQAQPQATRTSGPLVWRFPSSATTTGMLI